MRSSISLLMICLMASGPGIRAVQAADVTLSSLEAAWNRSVPGRNNEKTQALDTLGQALDQAADTPARERLLARAELDFHAWASTVTHWLADDGSGQARWYLRAGRYGLWSLSLTGEQGQVWQDGVWQPLTGDSLSALGRALDMVRGERPPDLVLLPLSVVPETVQQRVVQADGNIRTLDTLPGGFMPGWSQSGLLDDREGLTREVPVREGDRWLDRIRAGGPVPLDLNGGAALAWRQQAPDAWTRIRQGGLIGALILVMGAIGGLYGGFCLVRLLLTRSALSTPGHPMRQRLETLLQTGTAASDWQVDTELGALARRLERGTGLTRLFAGLSPMLGLVGTVAGLVVTFRAIQGSDLDLALMSQGIARALVTTIMGILVAVPLMVLQALLQALASDTVDQFAATLGDRRGPQ
jgi:hypothetical protein